MSSERATPTSYLHGSMTDRTLARDGAPMRQARTTMSVATFRLAFKADLTYYRRDRSLGGHH